MLARTGSLLVALTAGPSPPAFIIGKPQTSLGWGVNYFILRMACERLIYLKSANLSGKRQAAEGVQFE
jgi:hypothetical protein